MSPTDIEFRKALHEFRRECTIKTFGRIHLNNLGPGLIMGDTVLEHIADCARVNKLTSPDSLYRETKWSRAQEHGNEVLALVNRCVISSYVLNCPDWVLRRYYPHSTSPFVTTPLQPRQSSGASAASTPITPTPAGRLASRTRRCGRCGQIGHNSKFSLVSPSWRAQEGVFNMSLLSL